MVSPETKSVIDRAKKLYATLREDLEAQHFGRFVAIEPESGDYLLADTFDDAVESARTKHPTRLSPTFHIGQPAAIHIGLLQFVVVIGLISAAAIAVAWVMMMWIGSHLGQR